MVAKPHSELEKREVGGHVVREALFVHRRGGALQNLLPINQL
jgi:hypothetical protein